MLKSLPLLDYSQALLESSRQCQYLWKSILIWYF